MQTKQSWWRCGLLVAGLWALFGVGRVQAGYRILHHFMGGEVDGELPSGSLTLSGTMLYGMTRLGGADDRGVVFSINVDGSGFNLLHSFRIDGPRMPQHGSLTLSGSTLYGMTWESAWNGAIFKMHADGTGFEILHEFLDGQDDGAWPFGSLTLDGSTLYGMTSEGGWSGAIFRIGVDGSNYANLHIFDGGVNDGAYPVGSLALSGGTLYGMTLLGGTGDGDVFKIGVDGTGYVKLHDFHGGASDGLSPWGSLTLSGSDLYGMTYSGGAGGAGVVFRIQTNGTGYTNLHNFAGGWTDGEGPKGDLTLSGTTLYGMTKLGGASGDGTIFKINTDGSGFSLLHSFTGWSGGTDNDGDEPEGSLTLSGSTLYGMTSRGGDAGGKGVVFALTLGPTPTPSPNLEDISIIDSGDYNGDGTSDIAIFRGSSGMWSVRNLIRAYLGNSTDSLVPSDYNGDGTTDIAIFRQSSGMWSVRNLSRFYLGITGDVPVPGDYIGNGTSEAGLFRASAGLWAIRNVTRAYFGSTCDSVVPGYYNSDSIKDIAIFRGSTGMWSVRGISRFYFGASTDDLVPGDYNGAGKWEGGIFRPSTGMWSIRNITRFYLGNSTDQPVPADYDGDGADDAGIFRDSAGMWAVRNLSRVYFGSTDDVPVTR